MTHTRCQPHFFHTQNDIFFVVQCIWHGVSTTHTPYRSHFPHIRRVKDKGGMFVPCSQSQLTVLWVNRQPPLGSQTGSRTALHTLAWLSTKPLKPPIELPQRPHPGTPVWRQDTGHTDRPKPRAPECPTCHLTHGTARRCTAAGGRRLCGAALRDTIVNFGDPLPAAHLDAATRHAEQSDLMLCLGPPRR